MNVLKSLCFSLVIGLAGGCKSQAPSQVKDTNAPETKAAFNVNSTATCQIGFVQSLKQTGPGEIKVVLTITNLSPNGWIGLYRPGVADAQYSAYAYVSNGQNLSYTLTSVLTGDQAIDGGQVEVRGFCGASFSTKVVDTLGKTLLSRTEIFSEAAHQARPSRLVACPANQTSPHDLNENGKIDFADYKVWLRALLGAPESQYLSGVTSPPDARFQYYNRLHAKFLSVKSSVGDLDGDGDSTGSNDAILMARALIYKSLGFDITRPHFIEGLTLTGTRNTAPLIAAYFETASTTCRFEYGSEPGTPSQVYSLPFGEMTAQGIGFQQCENNSIRGDESCSVFCQRLNFSGGNQSECGNGVAACACSGRGQDPTIAVRQAPVAFDVINDEVDGAIGDSCHSAFQSATSNAALQSACHRRCGDNAANVHGFASVCHRSPTGADDAVSCVCAPRRPANAAQTNRLIVVRITDFATPAVNIIAPSCAFLRSNTKVFNSACSRLCALDPLFKTGRPVECGGVDAYGVELAACGCM